LPISWGGAHTPSKGKLLEVLGWPDDAHVDMLSVIRKYSLPTDFPDEVETEVNAIPEEIPADELARREDWTNQCIVTIDPEGARDFDDAIHVRTTDQGWVLAVHIADVSYYVPQKSCLDKEAWERGNSTYLPDRVLPMLPHRLSDDLCSLRSGVVRLTKVCEMTYDKHGKRTGTRFADAYICNKSQLTYPEAFRIMHGTAESDRDRMIQEAWKLAQILRNKRFENGALDLEIPEVRVLLNAEGRCVSVVSDTYDESHQLIEEFMIAANEAVAEALKNNQLPTIYRVHEVPDDGKLSEFADLCRQYHLNVPPDLQVKGALGDVLAQIKGHTDEQLLRLALLKSLMRARYDTAPLGHYGLALTNYCHFTSPIRRYADLVVHRSLSRLLSNARPHPQGAGKVEELQATADHISDTERTSAEAEKESNMIKLFEWLDDQAHSKTPEVLHALITDVRHFGLLIEIPRLQIKGLIRSDDLPNGRWFYEGFADRWSNTKGTSLYPGCAIDVVPIRVDREKQWVDFSALPTKMSSRR
jgi:ribonuclease R